MADEPGGWELRRALSEQGNDMRAGFAQLNARLDKLVSTEAFTAAMTAEQRRVDERLKDLADDIAAEKAARTEFLADEKAARIQGDERQQRTLDKLTANIRWVGAGIVLPIALFVADLIARRGT